MVQIHEEVKVEKKVGVVRKSKAAIQPANQPANQPARKASGDLTQSTMHTQTAQYEKNDACVGAVAGTVWCHATPTFRVTDRRHIVIAPSLSLLSPPLLPATTATDYGFSFAPVPATDACTIYRIMFI